MHGRRWHGLTDSICQGSLEDRKNIGVGCYAFLQGIFPTQGSNPGLPHCRQILYRLCECASQARHVAGGETEVWDTEEPH